ncbi:MAG: type II secretion system protein [Bythopirellula sp.]|nr:type II secretion system protein [Bythopirellula sp.]
MEKKNTGTAATQRVARCKGERRQPCVALRHGYAAFTLTELLVVITIIAILASLITAGAMNAMRASKRAAITLEIGQLADAMERFKTNTGGAYPPNAMNDNSSVSDPNYLGDSISQQTINDFIRSFRKAFPRHNEPEGLLRRLAGQTGSLPAGNPTDLDGGMNAAEAIYFWLGGFSSDPVYPISGPGGPSFADATNPATAPDLSDEILENRDRLYEFDLTRLSPRTDAGDFDGRWLTYDVVVNGVTQQRRINLWTYAPKSSVSSYAYFDTSRYDPVNYDLDLSGVFGSNIFALKKLREGFSGATPTPADIHFVNKKKFQILHAGLDDEWGDFTPADIMNSTSVSDASNLLLFPTGPFTGDIADTLSNFSGGTLESEQE